jgi:hypothetical protein
MRVGLHIIEKVKNANANQCANAMRMRIAINLFVRMRCECEFQFALPALVAGSLLSTGYHIMSKLRNNECTRFDPGLRLMKVYILIRQVRCGARADCELAWSRRCMTLTSMRVRRLLGLRKSRFWLRRSQQCQGLRPRGSNTIQNGG